MFCEGAVSPSDAPAIEAVAWAGIEEAREKAKPGLLAGWVGRFLSVGDRVAVGELGLFDDLLNQGGWRNWAALSPGSEWSGAMAAQREWRERVLRVERSSMAGQSWESALPQIADASGVWSAIPLVDGGMLWDEGQAMRHCVATYAASCVEGTSRIFSVREDGVRFGTLELGLEDGAWRPVQFLGPCNKPLDCPEALAFCDHVARSLGEAMGAGEPATARRVRP